MFLSSRITLLAFAFTIVLGAGAQSSASFQTTERLAGDFKVLVFSRTEGFRHDSIGEGLTALNELGVLHGFTVDATEDDAFFTANDLSQYRVVVFLNTTGDVLDEDEQSALEAFVAGGGGWVGIHSAADTEYDWAWYEGLAGALFDSHAPGTPTATVNVIDRVHPSTAGLPARWERVDEWYNFRSNPRGSVHVLATVEESTYSGGNMGIDHPIAWCQEYEGGRSFYTALGHTPETFAEPLFREHLAQGLLYAAGFVPGECGATVGANFDKKVLDANPVNPMALEIAPDGRVLYVERGGRLRIYDPIAGTTSTAATLNVVTANEDGLLGIALDPEFETNGWLYLFYSPTGSTPKQHVSRFTLNGGTLDLSSEKLLLEIPVQRVQCCHSGGELEFDNNGDLYIATGDNTNPFDTGYAPIDERAGRSPWDAQGSSGNADALTGKILRITPLADGTYAIPDGNLFPSDGTAGRPEIYVMGVRNPFRFAIDPFTNWLYWGDVGPDAQNDDVNRGPIGLDEWNQARSAGNYGWPYCVGPNRAYVDFDFATSTSGSQFDCVNGPTNNSPNNTGPTVLPPAEEAWIYYPYQDSPEFPAIPAAGGRTAMAGPIYAYDETSDSEIRFPAYFSGTPLLYEWSRNFVLEARLDENGDLLALQRVFSDISLNSPMSMKYGPDGALYVIEWGSGFGGNNEDAQIVRIEYVRASRSPVVFASADVTSGLLPLTVQFSSAGTFDPDPGDALTFSWDFDGDTVTDSNDENPTHVYSIAGTFLATLSVQDSDGNKSTASIEITAGNSRPSVAISKPLHGGFYDWGDDVEFDVSASDPEDGSTDAGTIDCGDVVFQPFTGHNDHSHPLQQYFDCSGVFATESGHGDGADNVFHVVEVSYTDAGSGNDDGLTARALRIIRPKRVEVEHYDFQSGTQTEPTGDVLGGGQNVGYISDGDYIGFKDVNLHGISFVTYRVASDGAGGNIEMRVGSPQGPIVSISHVEPTGNWQVYREVSAPVEDLGGTDDLYLVFKLTGGTGDLMNLNWMEFIGDGISVPTTDGSGGLWAKYFQNDDFSGRSFERMDAKINFDWGTSGPYSLIGGDTFSARWVGWVEAQYTEPYRFYTRSSDGMRLWVNDELLIDGWDDNSLLERTSPPIELTAGEKYPIRVEYFENTGEAQAHLRWSSSSAAKEIVPPSVLFPDSTSTIASEFDNDTPRNTEFVSVYPNPSSGQFTLVFETEIAGDVRLELLDLLGRRLEVLVDERRPSGVHTVSIDRSNLAVGSYVCRLYTATGVDSRILTVVR